MSEEAKSGVTIKLPRKAPIPVPWSVRWKEFRISVLPAAMFLLVTGAAYYIWQNTATSTGVTGIGEGVRSMISSPSSAKVQEILVRPYQMVNAGDPVAVVAPIDPRAELGLMQAELDLARLALQPSIAEENAMNFESIRIDLLRTKSELAIAKVNLQRLENQVQRNAPLFAEKLVSEDLYDLSVKTRDMFQVEVFEKSNAVAQIEKRLEELKVLGIPQTVTTNSSITTTLNHLYDLRVRIATNWLPVTLRAPIAGMVSGIFRQAGESAVEGELLMTINSPISDRVVAYLRQPYTVEPEVGLEVLMVTRERKPRRVVGTITQIGAQMEIITNALAFIRTGMLVDAGLPVVVSVPAESNIRPGEILDLTFRKPRNGSGVPGGLIQPLGQAADRRGQQMAIQ